MARDDGMKNTLRFKWKKDVLVMGRQAFRQDILLNSFGLEVKDMFCLQDNPRERGFDLTLQTSRKCLDALMFWWRRQELQFKDFEVQLLGQKRLKTITVHMYNPHVTKDAILAFLSPYIVDIGPGGDRKLLDKMGIWTGKIEFFGVGLKTDPDGYDGVAHPPAFFNIGADRGVLVYPGQPPFCKKCRVSGHRSGDCTERPAPKACHSCRSTDHLFKDCPGRGRAGGGRPGGGVPGTATAEPPPLAGGGGKTDSRKKEAPAKASAETEGQKGGARTGSQAFNGAGASSTAPGKKVKGALTQR